MKMHSFDTNQTREEYLQTQVVRSQQKLEYCKVSFHDVLKYKAITGGLGPVLCLGTRKGREVDLFRLGFFYSSPLHRLIALLEREKYGFASRLPMLETIGRSSLEKDEHDACSVFGVEINPQARRQDVWIGSFDEMPATWENRFAVIYSNSFDQSQDPYKSAAEWFRVLKPGGYLVFCYSEGIAPTLTDPVGGIDLAGAATLFTDLSEGSEIIYYMKSGSRNHYSELILKKAG
jgi:SAM-dependent methyltransferase